MEKFIRSIASQALYIVFSDLDRTIRWDNQSVNSQTEAAIRQFRQNGGCFTAISGSPLRYIPDFLREPFSFAEFGAVFLCHRQQIILVPKEGQVALQTLKSALQITQEDGLQMRNGQTLIVGGPRFASLNFITGNHPGYPGMHASWKTGELFGQVREIIQTYSLSVLCGLEKHGSYDSINITTMFQKAHAVEWFQRLVRDVAPQPIYYMGDGESDYGVMRLDGVIPVVFSNSVPLLHDIAKKKAGIVIGSPGPDGGVIRALHLIQGK